MPPQTRSLVVRTGVPIFVDEDILAEVGIQPEEALTFQTWFTKKAGGNGRSIHLKPFDEMKADSKDEDETDPDEPEIPGE